MYFQTSSGLYFQSSSGFRPHIEKWKLSQTVRETTVLAPERLLARYPVLVCTNGVLCARFFHGLTVPLQGWITKPQIACNWLLSELREHCPEPRRRLQPPVSHGSVILSRLRPTQVHVPPAERVRPRARREVIEPVILPPYVRVSERVPEASKCLQGIAWWYAYKLELERRAAAGGRADGGAAASIHPDAAGAGVAEDSEGSSVGNAVRYCSSR